MGILQQDPASHTQFQTFSNSELESVNLSSYQNQVKEAVCLQGKDHPCVFVLMGTSVRINPNSFAYVPCTLRV